MAQPDRPFRDEPTEVLRHALALASVHASQAARFRPQDQDGALPSVAALFRTELQHREEQTPADEETLVHVGWWCWRGDNHGHLATMACRSDNVPIHVPAEWADEMRAVIQRIEDGDDEPAPVAQQPAAEAWVCKCPAGLCGCGHHAPAEQQDAAADGEETRFLTRVLEIFSLSHADAYGDLFWRVENGTVHLSVNVSDVFAWGGADTEPITPEALPALEQAYIDLKALNAEHFTAELYAARQRRERPQGAAYPDERDQGWREVSALLDACGPERQLGLGNPKTAPAHRDSRP